MDENAAEAVSICIALRTISDRRGEFQGNRGACLRKESNHSCKSSAFKQTKRSAKPKRS